VLRGKTPPPHVPNILNRGGILNVSRTDISQCVWNVPKQDCEHIIANLARPTVSYAETEIATCRRNAFHRDRFGKMNLAAWIYMAMHFGIFQDCLSTPFC
jgi:hypothetical protein